MSLRDWLDDNQTAASAGAMLLSDQENGPVLSLDAIGIDLSTIEYVRILLDGEEISQGREDFMITGDGADTIVLTGAREVVYTGAGNDRIETSGTAAVGDTIIGGDGRDSLVNTGGTFFLTGLNDGVNVSGIEFLDGNGAVLKGTNSTNPDNTFNLADVNVKNGSITRIEMQGGDDTVTGAGRDHLIYDLGSGNDVFQGTGNAKDTVVGGSGDDIINTAGGADLVILGDGDADTIDTGAGNDRIETSGTAALGDTIIGGEGRDSLVNTGGTFFLTGLNDGVNVTGIEFLDGNGAVLKGTNSTNPDNTFNLADVNVKNGSITRIEMQGGDDTVTGAGRDHLIYDLGSGNDVFQGTGNAKDTVVGGGGNDIINTAGGADLVILGDGDADTIDTGAGNDRIETSGTAALGDTIIGGEGRDSLVNTGGTFFLTGLNDGVNVTGIDFLDGNGAVLKGTNSNNPDNTFNLADVDVKNGSITRIEMQGGDDTVTGAGRDHLIYDLGSGNDVFQGTGNAKDTVVGGSGDDIINTAGGADIIEGGAGSDMLNGGDGNDTFKYSKLSDVLGDEILDFDDRGNDVLDFSALGLVDFVGTAEFGGEVGQVRVYQDDTHAVIEFDVNGNQSANFTLTLADTLADTLTDSDFIF